MVISVTQEAKKNQIPVARIHTSSATALRAALSEVGGRLLSAMAGARARRGSGQPGEELRHSGPPSGTLPGGILRPHLGGHQNGQHVLHPPGRRGLPGKPKWPSGTRRSGERGSPCGCCGARGDRALLYLFRPARLQQDLDQPGARSLLARYGYRAFQAEEALAQLQTRLREQGGFPHEIGLFLGYPLGGRGGLYPQPGQKLQMFWVLEGLLQRAGGPKAVRPDTKVQAGLHPPVDTRARSLWQLTVAA